MNKFLCTLTIFVLLIAAFIASFVIQVPFLGGGTVPLIIAILATLILLAVGCGALWLTWRWSDSICSALRRSLDRRRAKQVQA